MRVGRPSGLLLAFAIVLAGCHGEDPVDPTDTIPERLLRPEPYPRIVFEVDIDSGQPEPEGIPEAFRALAEFAMKPVVYQRRQFVDFPDGPHTLASLQGLHEGNFSVGKPGPTFSEKDTYLHLLVLSGLPAPELGLGRAAAFSPVEGDTVYYFPDAVDAQWEQANGTVAAGGWNRTDLEAVALVHQMGHLVGLVDCGIPMERPHAAVDSPCHSANPYSLMSAGAHDIHDWPQAVEGSRWGPFSLDGDDRADLEMERASSVGSEVDEPTGDG